MITTEIESEIILKDYEFRVMDKGDKIMISFYRIRKDSKVLCGMFASTRKVIKNTILNKLKQVPFCATEKEAWETWKKIQQRIFT